MLQKKEKLAAERFIEWWYAGDEETPMEETGAEGVWWTKLGFPTAYLPLAETDAYKNNAKLAALSLDDNSNESIWIVTDPEFPGWAETIGVVSTMTEYLLCSIHQSRMLWLQHRKHVKKSLEIMQVMMHLLNKRLL